MKREEIDNLLTDFDEMGFCPTPFTRNAEAYACQWRDNMRNAIINHEQNILKEFVKFIKDNWAGEIRLWEKALETSSASSCERKAIEQKLISMRKMLGSLDDDIETFLQSRIIDTERKD